MSSRELVVLGTASQAPTRYRAHNGFALRWDDQLILFDPGEGAQRQCILAGVAIARVTAICVTHFHGDHCLGLPGVIQRRALDAGANPEGLDPLPVWYPADGADYLDRLRRSSIFHDISNLDPQPVERSGPVGTIGGFELTAHELDHRVTAYGYRLQEPSHIRLDPERLDYFGLSGPTVGRLLAAGEVDTDRGVVHLDQVSYRQRGQSMAFIMDTAPCPAVVELARDVDLMVCEATYQSDETELARAYKHLTAAQAARLAVEAGARRLVLGHFSARYTDNDGFVAEAGAIHPDVVAARDLATIEVPPRDD